MNGIGVMGINEPMYSLAGTLETVAPHVPPALVPPSAWSRVLSAARCMPAPLTDWIYLECRLLTGAPHQVDLIWRLSTAGRDLLVNRDTDVTSLEQLAGPHWGRLHDLCRRWADPGSVLHRAIDYLWLEFDLAAGADGSPSHIPLPGVFVDFADDPGTRRSCTEPGGVLELVLEILHAGPFAQSTTQRLRECLAKIPDGAYVPCVGYFSSRNGEAVRLCVANLDDITLPTYLGDIAWPGSSAGLQRSIAPLAFHRTGQRKGVSMLHLDLTDAVLPKISVECGFAHAPQIRGQLVETALLDELVSRGLCSSSQRDDLKAWPGLSVAVLGHELWPSLVMRRVNHLKVVYEGDRLAEVKAYLSLSYKRRQPRPPIADVDI